MYSSAKMLSLSGGLRPPSGVLPPGSPPRAPTPDPRYRLALPCSPYWGTKPNCYYFLALLLTLLYTDWQMVRAKGKVSLPKRVNVSSSLDFWLFVLNLSAVLKSNYPTHRRLESLAQSQPKQLMVTFAPSCPVVYGCVSIVMFYAKFT